MELGCRGRPVWAHRPDCAWVACRRGAAPIRAGPADLRALAHHRCCADLGLGRALRSPYSNLAHARSAGPSRRKFAHLRLRHARSPDPGCPDSPSGSRLLVAASRRAVSSWPGSRPARCAASPRMGMGRGRAVLLGTRNRGSAVVARSPDYDRWVAASCFPGGPAAALDLRPSTGDGNGECRYA